MPKNYDLIIYGATGFTGSVATQHLMKSSHFGGMRIAISGRNIDKLKALQQSCEKMPDMVIADSSDPASVDAMVRSTNVLLNFAGPFAWYAEPVISACAEHGTHYLDITGETAFIRDMMDKYQEQAKKSGARLIPFCGFDSVPADLTTFLALETARKNHLHLDELHLYYQIKGGFNGGSLATLFNMAETDSLPGKGGSNILIPDASWPKELATSSAPRYEANLSRWSAAFFMAPINKAVVRRSSWLRSQLKQSDTDFQYDERLLMSQHYGCAQAYLATVISAGFGLLSRTSFGRKILRRWCPQPGEGPSETERLKGFFRVQLVGSVAGQAKVKISMEREGDPGNEITAALAIECTRLAMANQFATKETGFLTPAIAFGMPLRDHLEEAGFRFKTELIDAELVEQAACSSSSYS